ncbi:MAG: signal peptide peptidase SppA [Chlorobiaceae bacterium]
MNKDQNKRWGCFRYGCLTALTVPLLIFAVIFFVSRSSRSLPDRFVLRMPIGGEVAEIRGDAGGLPFIASRAPLSLQDMLFILEHASTDERVREVLLEIGGLRTTPAKLSELQAAIEKVRARGKKVTAFLSSAEDSDYLLASACDSIVIERGGYLLLDGLKAETLYYTSPLGKIGVKFQAAQWKKYKSGIEPFTRTGPSPESLEEIGALLDEVYDNYLSYVSRHRKITRASFEGIINGVALMTAERARSLGLVDAIASRWDEERIMTRKITGKEPEGGDDALVTAARYRSSVDWPVKPASKERIAVITLSGPIVRTAGEDALELGSGIDLETLHKSLDAALEQKQVKAIVLRIDSPGGDALASAEMLEMLDSAAVKKPLVVSMSGVAASGGYMAALAGKTIFAQPLTITGSIGVYALKPDLSGAAEKLGLQRSVVARGRFADANTPFKPLDQESYRKFVEASGEVYQDFIGKVARSRKMTVGQVDAVAGGRVWTGRQAMKAGLVDRAGGLLDAVREAGRLAGMDSKKTPRIMLYPEQKTWVQTLFSGGGESLSSRVTAAFRRQLLHEMLPVRKFSSMEAFYAEMISSGQPRVLAVMPSEIEIR